MSVLPTCFSATHEHSNDNCGLCVALGVGWTWVLWKNSGSSNNDQGKSWRVLLLHDPSLLNLSLSLLLGYWHVVLGGISRCPLVCMTTRDASFVVVSTLAKTKPYVKNPMWKTNSPKNQEKHTGGTHTLGDWAALRALAFFPRVLYLLNPYCPSFMAIPEYRRERGWD